jgi:tetratricopeptide (TPR) repeat protein
LELLRRNPDHREARLMLADLYVSTNKPAAAEKHLRLLLENDDDARAHHALGLLLEISGKSTEALTHFQRAQTLEPGNELYAASYAAAQTTAEPTAAKSGRRVALATLGEKGRPRSRDAQAPSDPVAGEPQAKW